MAVLLIGPFLGKKMLVPLTEVSALAFIFACTVVSLACLRMRTTEPDLPGPYKVPGGRFGIMLAVLDGLIVILLLVLPFSPAALTTTGWIVVIAWILIGLVLRLISNAVNKKANNIA